VGEAEDLGQPWYYVITADLATEVEDGCFLRCCGGDGRTEKDVGVGQRQNRGKVRSGEVFYVL
jgi:hypothetical protein